MVKLRPSKKTVKLILEFKLNPTRQNLVFLILNFELCHYLPLNTDFHLLFSSPFLRLAKRSQKMNFPFFSPLELKSLNFLYCHLYYTSKCFCRDCQKINYAGKNWRKKMIPQQSAFNWKISLLLIIPPIQKKCVKLRSN